MKIQLTKKNTKAIQEFGDREWGRVVKEHYGIEYYEHPEELTLTATEKGKIIGMAYFRLESGVVYLDYLQVDHNFVSNGLGTKLMQEMEQIVKEKGAHKIYLFTGKDWEAEKFYQKMGYLKTADLKNHYFKKDWVEYTKFL